MYTSSQRNSFIRQNNSFLKSKNSIYQQHSQYVLHQSDDINKENISHQINKSKHSHSSIIRDKSFFKQKSDMIASKSRPGLLTPADQMVKSNFLLQSIKQNRHPQQYIKIKQQQMQQENRYKNSLLLSNQSMPKSNKNYNNNLKVLTQSDLTQNQQSQKQDFMQNGSVQQQRSRRRNKVVTQQNRSLTNQGNNIRHKQAGNLNLKYHPQKQDQYQQQHYEQQNQSFEQYIPSHQFLANQKLQIRYCQILKGNPRQQQIKKVNLYHQIINCIPHLFYQLKKVKKLSITHSSLAYLQGIQQFQELQQINFRKNQLRQVQQLYRIRNKQKIVSINIVGNDIQHYHQCAFHNLSKIFINLKQLNDKNYGMYKHKQKGNMREIIKKSAKIQYQFKKTLKRQNKSTSQALFKFNLHNMIQTQRNKQTQFPNIFNKKTQKDLQDNCYQNQSQCNSISRKSINQNIYCKNSQKIYHQNNQNNVKSKPYSNIKTRRYTTTPGNGPQNQVYEIQQSNFNSNSYSLGEHFNDTQHNKQKKNHKATINNASNNNLKQLSLGNLENVPITKSVVKYQKNQASGSKSSNKKYYLIKETKENYTEQNDIPLQTVPIGRSYLQIKTEGLDNVSQMNTHLHQPTATFAMQKEKQLKYSQQNKQFMFKNKSTKPVSNPLSSSPFTNNKKKQYIKQNDYIHQQQYYSSEGEQQMNLSRLSKISQIPTKRLSNYNKRNSMIHNKQQNNKSTRNYQNYYNAQNNNSQQSFMTANQLCIAMTPGNNASYLVAGPNASYFGFSQISRFRPNQSMDDDCPLKDNNDVLEQNQMAIATALYLRNLITKVFNGFKCQGSKRKNMPKKRVFF